MAMAGPCIWRDNYLTHENPPQTSSYKDNNTRCNISGRGSHKLRCWGGAPSIGEYQNFIMGYSGVQWDREGLKPVHHQTSIRTTYSPTSIIYNSGCGASLVELGSAKQSSNQEKEELLGFWVTPTLKNISGRRRSKQQYLVQEKI